MFNVSAECVRWRCSQGIEPLDNCLGSNSCGAHCAWTSHLEAGPDLVINPETPGAEPLSSTGTIGLQTGW